jgi:Signal transduction histidine kinase
MPQAGDREAWGGEEVGAPFDDSTRLGRELRAVHWERTPLGPPETWPRSLTTVVRLVIASRFSMWMAWGPELTFFCNDAYRRDTLGVKYPWALGRPVREVWAEIWDDVGPRIESVLAGGGATWDESLLLFLERSGYVEETYHTFSYSPLVDDRSAIAGMLCVVTEDTDRVIAERRMETLRELGGALAVTNTEAEVHSAASRQLAANQRDLPFTLLYQFDEDRAAAQRAASTGMTAQHPASPPVIRTADPDAVWPVADLAEGRALVLDDLARRFPTLPRGAWDESPTHALAVPLAGAHNLRRPYGFLLAGLNRYRPLDAAYRGFVDLVAGQLSAALDRARAYEAEKARIEQLAELDRAKTAFFTNVSHELRTPLTLLLGPAEDALRDEADPLPPTQRRRVEIVQRNGERLLKLVNTLLDFSRIESGRTVARYEPLDLARYTADLAAMFESAIKRAGLAYTIDCAAVDEPVYVDRELWAKIVLNLLSNALKATFEGGITVRFGPSDDGWNWSSATPVSASRRPSSPCCSSASAGYWAHVRAATRAPASGWRWSPNWSRCTAAVSTWTARWARGAASRCASRSAPRTCPPSSSPRQPRTRPTRAATAPVTSPRPAAGSTRPTTYRPTAHPTTRCRGRACWSSTTTPTCATTSPGCSPTVTRSAAPPTAERRSTSPAPTRPISCSPT